MFKPITLKKKIMFRKEICRKSLSVPKEFSKLPLDRATKSYLCAQTGNKVSYQSILFSKQCQLRKAVS